MRWWSNVKEEIKDIIKYFDGGPIEKNTQFKQAMAFYESQQYGEALDIFYTLLEQVSKHEIKGIRSLHLLIGNCHWFQKNYDSSLAAYVKVKELSKPHSKEMAVALSNTAAVFFARGEYEETQKALSDALEHGERDPDLLYNLACIHQGLGEHDKAIIRFEEANAAYHQKGKSDDEVFNCLAWSHYKLGAIEAARHYCERALASAHRKPAFYDTYACVLNQEGSYLEALEQINTAIELDGDHPYFLVTKIRILSNLSQKMFDETNHKLALSFILEAIKSIVQICDLIRQKGMKYDGLDEEDQSMLRIPNADFIDHLQQLVGEKSAEEIEFRVIFSELKKFNTMNTDEAARPVDTTQAQLASIKTTLDSYHKVVVASTQAIEARQDLDEGVRKLLITRIEGIGKQSRVYSVKDSKLINTMNVQLAQIAGKTKLSARQIEDILVKIEQISIETAKPTAIHDAHVQYANPAMQLLQSSSKWQKYGKTAKELISLGEEYVGNPDGFNAVLLGSLPDDTTFSEDL